MRRRRHGKREKEARRDRVSGLSGEENAWLGLGPSVLARVRGVRDENEERNAGVTYHRTNGSF